MDLFSEEDSRDELGIGAVRDALADLMFPAPAPSRRACATCCSCPGSTASQPGSRAAAPPGPTPRERREIALIDALERGGETVGVIGSVAAGR